MSLHFLLTYGAALDNERKLVNLVKNQPAGQACAPALELLCQDEKVSMVVWKVPNLRTPFLVPKEKAAASRVVIQRLW